MSNMNKFVQDKMKVLKAFNDNNNKTSIIFAEAEKSLAKKDGRCITEDMRILSALQEALIINKEYVSSIVGDTRVDSIDRYIEALESKGKAYYEMKVDNNAIISMLLLEPNNFSKGMYLFKYADTLEAANDTFSLLENSIGTEDFEYNLNTYREEYINYINSLTKVLYYILNKS